MNNQLGVSPLHISFKKPQTHSSDISYSITLKNREITVHRRKVALGDLILDRKNFRLQSLIHSLNLNESILTEEKFTELIWRFHFVRGLYNSIEKNGGLISPLFIMADGKVIEGNCRTVALRKLSEKYPGDERFANIPCEVIPDSISPEELMYLLGEWHVGGKHPWGPYEKAEYVYKAVVISGISIEEMSRHLRVPQAFLRQSIMAYQLAKEFLTRFPRSESFQKFSYFVEFVKKPSLQAYLLEKPSFKDLFFHWLDDGTIAEGKQIRELAVIVSNSRLKIIMEQSGFSTARAALLRSDPSFDSTLFRAVDDVLIKLRKLKKDEVVELDHGAKKKRLVTLANTLKKTLTAAGISLEKPVPRTKKKIRTSKRS